MEATAPLHLAWHYLAEESETALCISGLDTTTPHQGIVTNPLDHGGTCHLESSHQHHHWHRSGPPRRTHGIAKLVTKKLDGTIMKRPVRVWLTGPDHSLTTVPAWVGDIFLASKPSRFSRLPTCILTPARFSLAMLLGSSLTVSKEAHARDDDPQLTHPQYPRPFLTLRCRKICRAGMLMVEAWQRCMRLEICIRWL